MVQIVVENHNSQIVIQINTQAQITSTVKCDRAYYIIQKSFTIQIYSGKIEQGNNSTKGFSILATLFSRRTVYSSYASGNHLGLYSP